MKKTIIILGCLDSKGEEYGFIKRRIEKEGLDTILVDVGVLPLLCNEIFTDRIS